MCCWLTGAGAVVVYTLLNQSKHNKQIGCGSRSKLETETRNEWTIVSGIIKHFWQIANETGVALSSEAEPS